MVCEVGQVKTHGEKGIRITYRFTEQLDSGTVENHASTWFQMPYRHALRNVASKRCSKARSVNENDIVDGVLCGFFFDESEFGRVLDYAALTYAGEGMMCKNGA